eukprot:CAMPEP_0194208788 /NCGR_PEP_ID=MMETSP0156-20130528/7137_1 /TAXON_ID=33649 /ORGANISM="Thalassionema nitzschioides, Strain L26-B" /LENGTH=91 /DNA_ID=CAMNT_0038935821 /DNA_START=108 /DNA_END=383 /DNA_ORIENTATION=+
MVSSSIEKNVQPARQQQCPPRSWGTVQKISSIPTKLPFDIYRIFMADDGTFPNNLEYPVLLYKAAFLDVDDEENIGRQIILNDGGWTDPWV